MFFNFTHKRLPPKERFLRVRTLSEGSNLFECFLYFVLLYIFFSAPPAPGTHATICVVDGGGGVGGISKWHIFCVWRKICRKADSNNSRVKFAEKQIPIIQKSTSEKIELEAQAPLSHSQQFVQSCLFLEDV